MFLGRLFDRGDEAGGQASEILGIVEENVGFLVGENLVRKIAVEPGKFGAERDQLRLLVGREQRAVAFQFVISAFDEALLLGVEAHRIAVVVERLVFGDEPRIEIEFAEKGRKLGAPFGLYVAHLGGRQVTRIDAVYGIDAAQRFARHFERDDEILEGRLGLVRQDRFVIGFDLRHSRFERLRQLRRFVLIPLRHTRERTGPFGEQRVRYRRLIRRVGLRGSGVVDAIIHRCGATGEQRAPDEQRKSMFHGVPDLS